MVPVEVHGVALLSGGESPVMLLRETDGDRRWLAISVGKPEAQAILSAKDQIENVRPSTVELIGDVLHMFGRRVTRVEVTELRDDIFRADLVLDKDTRVSARPSDAVAIGLRAQARIEVAEAVFEVAAVELEVVEDASGTPAAAESVSEEEQIRQFRTLLEEVRPEDFGKDQ
ncbi:bifunctional nuclease family protein [Amycolatopsis aidingensis]|uniref:bifunctional nuclease family protein n=1 Tax=Amycolatopsis aidingensis TaxID=2842453 RepID=UPI001C0D7468|nr:bifunctional nuclease family protein [Amycolatopsis aidingensis]